MILALPLNLNLIEILIHLFNLTFLIFFIRWAIYKPVKKFVDKRKEENRINEEEREKAYKESYRLKNEYETLLAGAKQEALQITEKALEAASTTSKELVNDAKKKADTIIRNAEEEIKQKTREEKESLKNSVSDFAFSLANEILKQKIDDKEMDKQVNNIVKEWQNS